MGPQRSHMPAPATRDASLASEDSTQQNMNCIACAKRKVRCDRKDPCVHCKRRKEPCQYPEPFTSPRQARSVASDLDTRLKKLEQYVRDLGGDPESMATTDTGPKGNDTTGTAKAGVDRPCAKKAAWPPVDDKDSTSLRKGPGLVDSQYVESPMWFSWSEANESNKNDEQYQQQNGQQDSHGQRLQPKNFFGNTSGLLDPLMNTGMTAPLSQQHPPASSIEFLWTKFLSNVHPLVKVFFSWQKAPLMRVAAQDPGSLSQEDEALVFAIYFITFLSLAEDECQRTMGSLQDQLLDYFQSLVELALLRAGFIDSNSRSVLQAFMLYLTAMRNRTAPATLFSLMGIAVRNSERLGYQRDGSALNIPAVDAEERRRIWWQLQHGEIMIAQILGCSAMSLFGPWDTRLPANLDDDDIQPGMSELPSERPGLTSMSHCLWRYQILQLSRTSIHAETNSGSLAWLWAPHLMETERDDKIGASEKVLQEKYLQHCDPLNPLHVHLQIALRLVMLAARRLVRQPTLVNAKVSEMSQQARDEFLDICCKSADYYILMETTESLKHFSWHSENYFSYTSFAYVLIEAFHRASQPSCSELWRIIDKTYAVHPKMSKTTDRPEVKSADRLILFSWHMREKHLSQSNQGAVELPACVVRVREKLGLGLGPQSTNQTDASHNTTQDPGQIPPVAGQTEDLFKWDEMMMDFDALNWPVTDDWAFGGA